MGMPPIEFHVAMFRGDWDQARSQYVLLFLMEALCRVNQSLLRQSESMVKRGMVKEKLPKLYRAGVHYERERPGQEEWPDIVHILKKKGQLYKGPWGDCEDLACWRTAELRESPFHFEGQGETRHKVAGGVKARPFAKWRRGKLGQYNYHALLMRPDGKLEDPSLVLGMGKEKKFAEQNIAQRLKSGELAPVIQFAKPPTTMVVDPQKASGFSDRRDAKGMIGPISAKQEQMYDELLEGDDEHINHWHPQADRIRWKHWSRKIGQKSGRRGEGSLDGLDPYNLETPALDMILGQDETSKVSTPGTPARSTVTVSVDDLKELARRVQELEKRTYKAPEPYLKGVARRTVTRTVGSEVVRLLNRLVESAMT